jgi:uncharacterized membrane protein YeaQ/YmgE (transglycosylase-associated protein family)
VLGAIVGWAANLVVGGRDRRPQGCIVSILVGIAGAFLGGLAYRWSTGHALDFGWDFTSFGIALVGAVILLAVLSLFRGAGRGGRQ